MVDLHSHTDRSDGSLSPEQLIKLARRNGVRALAITDHDTLDAFDAAREAAGAEGVELVCGIELNTKFHGRAIHILGYFLEAPPGEEFREHLACLQRARRERNGRLSKRLQQMGFDIPLEEAEKLGRSQTGRPHFAQVMVAKGYVGSIREAFDSYLDESAPGYVERRDPSPENVLRWIREASGISSWAHPLRFIRESGRAPVEVFREMASKGLSAVEVYHSDHAPADSQLLLRAANEIGLEVTGGSDFHGPEKSRVEVGRLNLPMSLLDDLRKFSAETFGTVH